MKRVFNGIIPKNQAPHLFYNVLSSMIDNGLDEYLHDKDKTHAVKLYGGKEFKVTIIIERQNT